MPTAYNVAARDDRRHSWPRHRAAHKTQNSAACLELQRSGHTGPEETAGDCKVSL